MRGVVQEADLAAAPQPVRLPRGLRVEPFVGVRYAAERVRDLAAVTSPPYDVMDRAAVLAHETLHPNNVVRLVRPRPDGCGPEGPYAHASHLLGTWLETGVLRVDSGPGMYVYERGAPEAPPWQRGILAAVALGSPADSAVVPHEEVMPAPVADRSALMDRTSSNLEPILLLHGGEEDAGQRIEDAIRDVASLPAVAEVVDTTGARHRLWRLDDAGTLRAVRAAMGRRGALIADGHHRWAAYHGVQRTRRSARGAGPWDEGLALLVDPDRYPLHLGAIHRAVAGLARADALSVLSPGGSLGTDLLTAHHVADGAAALAAAGSPSVLLPGTEREGGRDVLLVPRERGALGRQMEELLPGRSDAYRSLSATLLHALLLPAWAVEEQRVSYHHDALTARRSATSSDGLAVLLPPTSLDSVLGVVAAGETMPRKSTSFGPKPLTGLVLRLLGTPTEAPHAAGVAAEREA